MRPIIYDYAMSLDGFICAEDGSVGGFVPDGEHVTEYMQRLQQYGVALMGRATYEFGYQFGLKPGQRAYEHMDHYIFSDSMELPGDAVKVVPRESLDLIRELKAGEGAPLYLCGGGVFAGYLLQHELIDQLVVKLNPFVMGRGRRPFGDAGKRVTLIAQDQKQYDNGVSLLTYDIQYPGEA